MKSPTAKIRMCIEIAGDIFEFQHELADGKMYLRSILKSQTYFIHDTCIPQSKNL